LKYNEIGDCINVSEVSFGGIAMLSGGLDIMPPHFNLDKEDSKRLLLEAYDFGINFYDTAIHTEYGDSEIKIGHAFNKMRDRIVISSKARAYTKNDMKKALQSSLKNLDTNYVDLYGIHQLSPSNFEAAMDPDCGAIRTLMEAKAKGIIRSITIGTHHADIAAECSKLSDIDMVQLPYNPLEYGLYDSALTAGLDKSKVVFHKILGGGMLPALCSVSSLLHFALMEKPVSVLVGIGNFYQLSELRQAYEHTTNNEEQIFLHHSECNRCQSCICTKGINISKLLRYRAYALSGFHRWAFTGFTKNYVLKCDRCGDCLTTCPRSLNIPLLIEEAENWFHNLVNYKEVNK